MIKLNVDKILKEKGKSKEWLCNEMDISHYNLNKVINGKTKSISFKYLENFCKALNCSFNELLVIIEEDEENK
jgi:putative transcriptional regulator